MANNAELGKTFLEQVFGKLPEGAQAKARELLSSPEMQAAYETVGSRVSPLDEERRRLETLQNQLNTREQKLNDWHGRLDGWAKDKETQYAERERKLNEREANPNPNANAAPNGTTPPGNQPGGTMTRDDIANVVSEIVAPREGAFVQYVADATNFSAFHLKNFNETLDVAAIVKHPDIGKIGFRGVYEQLHKEKLDQMHAAADKAKEDAIRADERAKVLAGAHTTELPYPVGEGSPLDALNLEPGKRPTGDPVAATRMYEQLVASGGRA